MPTVKIENEQPQGGKNLLVSQVGAGAGPTVQLEPGESVSLTVFSNVQILLTEAVPLPPPSQLPWDAGV